MQSQKIPHGYLVETFLKQILRTLISITSLTNRYNKISFIYLLVYKLRMYTITDTSIDDLCEGFRKQLGENKIFIGTFMFQAHYVYNEIHSM